MAIRNDYRLVDKTCEKCGSRLTLRNRRDVERKRFCSHECAGALTLLTALQFSAVFIDYFIVFMDQKQQSKIGLVL